MASVIGITCTLFRISGVTFEVSSCTECQIFQGSAPDPAGGAYSPPQTPSWWGEELAAPLQGPHPDLGPSGLWLWPKLRPSPSLWLTPPHVNSWIKPWPSTFGPSRSAWTTSLPASRLPVNYTHHRHFIITQPESWYSFYHPTEGRRLSQPSWLATYRNGLPARRRSPIEVLTGPGVE